jgi:hypothetical protein
MSEREFDRDAALETALRSLAQSIDYPPQSNLAAAVRERIEARPSLRRGPLGRASWWLRNVVASLREPAFAATVIVVLVSLVLMISPAARVAVADWLGFDDVRVTFDEPPVSPAPPVGGDLRLGRRVTLGEARSLVDFEVLVPEALGAPDEVYYNKFVSDGQVSLVYRESDDLPSAQGTSVGAIVTQFEADFLDQEFYQKFPQRSATVQEVTVAGVRAVWIDQPHALIFRSADGVVDSEDSRLSGPSLIWEKDGIVYRLESRLPLNRAITAAESLR